jgi:hypothetical protein
MKLNRRHKETEPDPVIEEESNRPEHPEDDGEEWQERDHDKLVEEHVDGETTEEKYRMVKYRGESYKMPVYEDLGDIIIYYTMDSGVYRVHEDCNCTVCDKKIKKGTRIRVLLRDAEHKEHRILHEDCGPGSKQWLEFHPSDVARLLLAGIEKTKKEKTEKLKKIFAPKTGIHRRQSAPVGIKRRTIQVQETPKARTRPTPDGRPFREGSKTEFVYGLLRKGVTLKELVRILTEKWGEKTGDEYNVRLYIKNISVRCPVEQKGDLWFAK